MVRKAGKIPRTKAQAAIGREIKKRRRRSACAKDTFGFDGLSHMLVLRVTRMLTGEQRIPGRSIG